MWKKRRGWCRIRDVPLGPEAGLACRGLLCGPVVGELKRIKRMSEDIRRGPLGKASNVRVMGPSSET